MPIEDLINKYLLSEADVDGHGCHPLVPTYENSFVTPLIDGYAYFQALFDAIGNLVGPPELQGIYIASWAFEPGFQFRNRLGTRLTSLVDLLTLKADEGADVRVLPWVSDYVMATGFAPAQGPLALGELIPVVRNLTKVEVQRANLTTVQLLRSHPSLADRIVANTLSDPLGAVHTKFALVFGETSAIGFTGGMDPAESRFSKPLHVPIEGHAPEGTGPPDQRHLYPHDWHDVMAMVEGEAVQAFFDFFRSMWNSLVAPATTPGASAEFRFNDPETNRPVTLIGTPVASTLISHRVLPPNSATAGSLMRVQSLRTVPKPSFQPFWGGAQPTSLPFNRPTIEGAGDGIFETEHALRKAIAAAETYIYVEDQKMEGSVLFSCLKSALQAKPNLKLIMLTGRTDPADPAPADRDLVLREFLTDGLQASEVDRIVFFEHQLAVVHAKLWLIDDKFAYIASANIFNRGVFIEIEHGVSFVHDGEVNQVELLRRDLWGEHFRLRPPSRAPDPPDAGDRADLFSLENALAIWNPACVPSATPTLTLPIYTDDDQRFQRRWADGLAHPFTLINQRSPSLCPLDLPVRDLFGGIKIVTLGGHDYQEWRAWNRRQAFVTVRSDAPPRVSQDPTGPITVADSTFIVDSTLPNNDASSGAPGLVGEWVMVFQTQTVWHIRKIIAHIGQRIDFAALPFSPDATTLDYGLLTPVLRRVPLPRPVSGLPFLPPWYFLVSDPKVDC